MKEIFKHSLESIPYALTYHMEVMVKTKISDILTEVEKGTVLVGQMPKSSCSITDDMALVRKVKCSGITFFHIAEAILKEIDAQVPDHSKNCWKSCSSGMELVSWS